MDALRVDGIFCGGVMAELWAFSLDERNRVHELVVRQVAGRVLCDHALEHGLEFGIAMNPFSERRNGPMPAGVA